VGLIRFAIENPVKIAVAVILVVMFGLLSIFEVGIQLIPDVDHPVITVKTRWTGASPQEIEREIVDKQEEKLKNVNGLKKMTSKSSQGEASITLDFPVGVDKDVAYRDVSDKLRQVSDYPEEVDEPTLSVTDSDMTTVIAWLILSSKKGKDVAELKTFIEENVKPLLERADGISEVSVYGGREREIQVEIDLYKLAARGLTLRDVERALRTQNENISAGTITSGKLDYSYRTIGEFTSIHEVEDTVVAYREGGPVLVRDVGTVIDGFKKAVSFVRSKGRRVIAMPARRSTGANVITATANLKRQIELVNREVLSSRGLNLELTQVYDETAYIWSAIGLVVKNIFMGGLLAVVVLLLFLRSGSATGIIAVAIPISVIGTMLVIWGAGRGLNVVLLAGMAFAVGMVVDNAIVVLENIYRHRSMGKSKMQAALDGTHEVWGAVLASTLTTIAVFLPVITMQDEAGQLFKDIAIAITSAVGLSLFVSVLVIPVLASRFFEARSASLGGGKPWWFARRVSSLVARINKRILSRVVVVVGISAAALVGSYVLVPPAEYLPSGNKNLIFGFLFTPPGYSLNEFNRMSELVEDGLPEDPYDGLRPFWEAKLGSELASKLPPVDIKLGLNGEVTRRVQPPPIENFFYVSFDGGAFMGCTSKIPTDVKPLENVMTRAASRIPGVFAMFSQTSLFSIGASSGGNTVDIEVRSNTLSDVVHAASAVRNRLREVGYSRPRPSPANFDLGRPEIRLIPDRAKSADLGLNVEDAGFVLRACVDGAYVGEFNDKGQRIDLALKVAGTEGASLRDIAQLPTYTPVGRIVPLETAFNFERTSAPQEIVRIEEMSAVTLAVKPKTGVALQETMRELSEDVIAPLRARGDIPETVITSLAGTADRLTQTRRSLLGDFRNTVHRPQLFGLSVGWSIAVLAGLALLASGIAGVVAGPRTGVRLALVAGAVLIVGFLVANVDFALMAFQSRAWLALLVTYLLMAALFESFAYPFVIMLSVPLAAVGGVAALDIVHAVSLYDPVAPIQQLDMLTMLGFVILIGIVVNNAILIVHQSLNNMRDQHLDPSRAVILAVQQRTRPIFMTALTSVFGMLPLVVMPGAGSELYRGLGSVVLGGLMVSTVFTLVVVPAMFTLLIDFQAWYRRSPSAATATGTLPSPVPIAHQTR